MPTVNWTTNGDTLADQCGWSGDGAAHPFVGQFYVDETYNTDSKASAVRLTGAGFSGTINSAILTLGRFNDNVGTNGTLRIRCIAENDPGSLAASGGVAPSARTYRTAYLDYNFPNDAVAVNIDITALIQDLLTAGFTYTGTQKIAIVIAGSSVGGTGWGSNPTVSWRALWLLSTPPTLAITYTAGGSTATGTGTATGSSTVSGSGKSFPRVTGAVSSSSTVVGSGLSSSRGTGASQSASLVSGSGASSGIVPSLAAHTSVAELYSSPESADGYVITASGITTTAGTDIFVLACTWQYNDTPSENRTRDREAPTDNKSGTYNLIGSVSTPTNWPTAGEAWYRNTTGTRGSGHLFAKNYGFSSEITVIAMEVANAGEISNFSIQQIPTSGNANQTYTASVTCNGPALLVVSMYVDWWEYTAGATPDGWVLVERKGILSPAKDADIHAVVFVREVTSAGTYTCPMAIAGYQAQAACIQTFAIEAKSATVGGSSVTSSSSVVGSGSSRAALLSSVSSSTSVVGLASSRCTAIGVTSGPTTAVGLGASICLATSAISCATLVTGPGTSSSSAIGPMSVVSTSAGSGTSRSIATGTASSSSVVVGSGESGAVALGYGPSTSASVATGSGSSRALISGAASSSASVTAPGASNVRGLSSDSGFSVTTGAGSSSSLANGSTSSSSAVVGSGSGVASGTGIGTVSSASAVAGSGASRVLASAPLSVSSATAGQGASMALGSGSTVSSSTAIGSGESAAVVVGTGQASSSSSVSGQAKAIIYALGGSAGQALAMAAGFSLVVATAPIYSVSSCSAVGSSVCLASGGAFSASTVIGGSGDRAESCELTASISLSSTCSIEIVNSCSVSMEIYPS